MNKAELAEVLDTQFWKECVTYLEEQRRETFAELGSLNFRDADSAITAHGHQKFILGIDEIFAFVEKMKEDAEV